MNIIRAAEELNPQGRKVCLAIGFFDGVHLGHQQIIRQTIADARQHDAIALVITFDSHPAKIVAPERAPKLIYSLPHKLRAIESLGADSLLLIHFDKPFSRQTGEQFIRALAADPGRIQTICVGANFTFGHKRKGNVALLEQLGRELGFTVHGMAAVSLGGKIISSTRVREAIQNGNFDLAGQMLGRAYSLTGVVVPGDRLGHQLGFPTANLDASELVLPPAGVYAARVIENGKSHQAVLNIGFRPTIQNPTPSLRVEIHLLDFAGELYGRELEVFFRGKLREEKKFASLAELKEQIARDISNARSGMA
ncbi:MAG TPA: bifunctional riboflavin kinase/FAD synthetase [Verrucomicrobiae bacterium]|nr:bifunctional riboflavin kinase/FAD synthetase [Verrucomicrobiae bacterium]